MCVCVCVCVCVGTLLGVRVHHFRKYNGTNLKEFLRFRLIHIKKCVSVIKSGNIANKFKQNNVVIYNLIFFR
jgi:hypothetical protein